MAIQRLFDNKATASAKSQKHTVDLDKLEIVMGPYIQDQRDGPYAYRDPQKPHTLDDLYLELHKDRATNAWNLILEVKQLKGEGQGNAIIINLSCHSTLREGVDAMDKEAALLKIGTGGFLSRMLELTPVRQDNNYTANETKAYLPQVKRALLKTAQTQSAEHNLSMH